MLLAHAKHEPRDHDDVGGHVDAERVEGRRLSGEEKDRQRISLCSRIEPSGAHLAGCLLTSSFALSPLSVLYPDVNAALTMPSPNSSSIMTNVPSSSPESRPTRAVEWADTRSRRALRATRAEASSVEEAVEEEDLDARDFGAML